MIGEAPLVLSGPPSIARVGQPLAYLLGTLNDVALTIRTRTPAELDSLTRVASGELLSEYGFRVLPSLAGAYAALGAMNAQQVAACRLLVQNPAFLAAAVQQVDATATWRESTVEKENTPVANSNTYEYWERNRENIELPRARRQDRR